MQILNATRKHGQQNKSETTDPFTAQRKNANIVVSYNGDNTN